jgi:hypothetical protein
MTIHLGKLMLLQSQETKAGYAFVRERWRHAGHDPHLQTALDRI